MPDGLSSSTSVVSPAHSEKPVAHSTAATNPVTTKDTTASTVATASSLMDMVSTTEPTSSVKDKDKEKEKKEHDLAALFTQYADAGVNKDAATKAKEAFAEHFKGKERLTITRAELGDGYVKSTYHDPDDHDNVNKQIHLTLDPTGKPIKIEAGSKANSVTSPISRPDGSFEVLEIKNGVITAYTSDGSKSTIAGVTESKSMKTGAAEKGAANVKLPGMVQHSDNTHTGPSATPTHSDMPAKSAAHSIS